MKSSKKLMAGAMALSMMMPMFAAPVFAKDAPQDNNTPGTGQTQVTYDNANDTPDPDNVDNPQWAVEIPSSINFTDDNKKIDADVKLKLVNGATSAAYPTSVEVSIKSAGGYKLTLADTTDPVAYVMQYGTVKGTLKTVTDASIGTLKPTSQETLFGQGVLKGTATKTGNHLDTLTYTLNVTK